MSHTRDPESSSATPDHPNAQIDGWLCDWINRSVHHPFCGEIPAYSLYISERRNAVDFTPKSSYLSLTHCMPHVRVCGSQSACLLQGRHFPFMARSNCRRYIYLLKYSVTMNLILDQLLVVNSLPSDTSERERWGCCSLFCLSFMPCNEEHDPTALLSPRHRNRSVERNFLSLSRIQKQEKEEDDKSSLLSLFQLPFFFFFPALPITTLPLNTLILSALLYQTLAAARLFVRKTLLSSNLITLPDTITWIQSKRLISCTTSNPGCMLATTSVR